MLKRLIVIAALSIAGPAFPQTQTAPWPSTQEDVQQCRSYCGANDPCRLSCLSIFIIVTSPEFTPEQRARFEPFGRWAENGLNLCGSDEPCQAIIRRTFGNSLRCAIGHDAACNERARDLADIERLNAQRRKRPTQQPAQDALLRCLQETADSTIRSCKETNCPAELLVDIIGEAQRIRCGYSAIQPIQPIQPPGAGTPRTDYICAENLMKGGMSWGMAMQACTR